MTNADGSGQTRITDNNDGDEDPDWSPDGAKFVFVSNRDGSHQIYSMNADGSGQTRLTNNNAEEWNCRWSPDGTKISFDTNRDGNFEIYVMNPDGSGQTRLTNNSAVDWDSSWQSLYMTHFRQIGIGSDFTGNVLNVDNSSYTINQLPTSIPWSPGTSHNFSWSSPLTVSNDKRYVWSSTSGLSTEKSGTFIATSGNDSITADYITQYYVRFQALTGGSIAQSSNWYNASSTVAISALPSIGYKFSYWTAAGNVLVADAASQNTTVTVNGAGNVTASFVDATPPSITNVTQFPVKTNVSPQDPVKINATVTDDLSGVQQVTLNYTTGNGTWTAITMSNLGGSTWNASIPTLSYGTNVTYIIMARDNAENNVTTQALGLTYNYQVVPEFPMLPIVFIIFTISTLLIVVLNKRKHRH